MWCQDPTNCRLVYTYHDGLTCKRTGRTPRSAGLLRACSVPRPVRQCVVCNRCALPPPSTLRALWPRRGAARDVLDTSSIVWSRGYGDRPVRPSSVTKSVLRVLNSGEGT
jgi:hypothetical protein